MKVGTIDMRAVLAGEITDPQQRAAVLSAVNEELWRKGCDRWPPHLLLLASEGYFVKGRCGSANLCRYCLIQEVHVIRRMLSLQAIAGPAPEVVAVLGTRTATFDPAPFYVARRRVMDAVRYAFGPAVGYACLSEFTTGKGTNSGGRRRPHWNVLLRGVSAEHVDQVRELVVPIWCKHVDAEARAQYVEPLRDTAALMRYVANHFSKRDQQPPQDGRWKHKQRFNCSRNYFEPLTRAQAREQAWWSLQLEREIVKAVNAGSEDAVGVAEAAIEQLRATSWVMYDRRAAQAPPEVVRLMHRAAVAERRWEAMVC